MSHSDRHVVVKSLITESIPPIPMKRYKLICTVHSPHLHRYLLSGRGSSQESKSWQPPGLTQDINNTKGSVLGGHVDCPLHSSRICVIQVPYPCLIPSHYSSSTIIAGTYSEGPGLLRVCARCSWSARPPWTSGTCWTRPPGCSASMRRRPGQNRASDTRSILNILLTREFIMNIHILLGASFLQESILQPWTLQR